MSYDICQQPGTSLLNNADIRDSHVDDVMASSYLRKSSFGKTSNPLLTNGSTVSLFLLDYISFIPVILLC
jgi:hypothetical protein